MAKSPVFTPSPVCSPENSPRDYESSTALSEHGTCELLLGVLGCVVMLGFQLGLVYCMILSEVKNYQGPQK